MRQGAKMTALTPQPFETSEKNTKSAREQSPILLALKIVVSLRSRLILFFVTPQTAREQALFLFDRKKVVVSRRRETTSGANHANETRVAQVFRNGKNGHNNHQPPPHPRLFPALFSHQSGGPQRGV